MSTLASFFRGCEKHFGTFYPRHYLVAVFPDFKAALHAGQSLRNAGFATEDSVAVPGEDMVQLTREQFQHHVFWTLLAQQLSRALGTEEVYADRDLEMARLGAGFVVVYCRSEREKRRAWRLLEPHGPLVARHYGLTAIEHLLGEN